MKTYFSALVTVRRDTGKKCDNPLLTEYKHKSIAVQGVSDTEDEKTIKSIAEALAREKEGDDLEVSGVVIHSMICYDLVIFDLDGTLTHKRDGACGKSQKILLPNVAAFFRELHALGVLVGVASNQSAARPMNEIVDQLAWTMQTLHITPGFVSFATAGDRKKPNPHMLNEIMRVADTEPGRTLFVGDQETDKQAAEAAGCGFVYARQFFGWDDEDTAS